MSWGARPASSGPPILLPTIFKSDDIGVVGLAVGQSPTTHMYAMRFELLPVSWGLTGVIAHRPLFLIYFIITFGWGRAAVTACLTPFF